MRKRLIYSLFLLFLLFSAGSAITFLHIYRTTSNLRSVIALHRVEIIRQNLVINAQTVQSHLYTIGTVFGREADEVVVNVIDLGNSVRECLGCHHTEEMTSRLNEMNRLIEDYKDALSYLITTSANPERVERLRTAAIGIGSSFLTKSQEMAFIADKRLNDKTVAALKEINSSRSILIMTLALSLFIALAIAVTITRQIAEPINELVDATRRIKAGELGHVTPYKGKGEFGELIDSFNDMSLTLKDSNQKVMHYLHNLSNLYSISLSFHAVTSMAEIIREFSTGIVELTGAEQGGILLKSEDEGVFVHVTPSAGVSDEIAREIKVKSDVMEELYYASKRRALVLSGDLLSSLPTSEADKKLAVRNIMLVWLRHKGKLIGAARVANKKKGDFTEEDIRLVAILANSFSVALDNAKLYESLRCQMQELRETQEQLVQAAKLAAIGELASNVAHEINNPLTSILGYAELIKEETNIGNVLRDIGIIEKESLRAREIVHQLLEFSRKKPLQMKSVDINSLMKSVIELVSVQLKDSRIKVVKDMGKDVPPIEGDEDQLKQVFLNIANNAVFSMENEGSLGVRTFAGGGMVAVEISDTGKGIPKDIIGRIFDPFFSTKNEKGTGLGLSISYKIVQSHSGQIEVESEEGMGSRFTVRLPAADAKAAGGELRAGREARG